MRRRWIVLLVGRARLGLGHRSELSRHRTLEGARVAALEAVARLREGPTGGARDYVVVIERDGDGVVLEEMAIEERPPGEAPRPPGEAARLPDEAPDRVEPPSEESPDRMARAAEQSSDHMEPAAEQSQKEQGPEPDRTGTRVERTETRAESDDDRPDAPEDVDGDEQPADEAGDAIDAREGVGADDVVAEADDVDPETPAEPTRPVHQVVVPPRYVPSEVARGLHDPAGRPLPGSERIPDELIRDWERKIARIEGRPPPGEEPGGTETEEDGG